MAAPKTAQLKKAKAALSPAYDQLPAYEAPEPAMPAAPEAPKATASMFVKFSGWTSEQVAATSHKDRDALSELEWRRRQA